MEIYLLEFLLFHQQQNTSEYTYIILLILKLLK